jgi:hypothetical protein
MKCNRKAESANVRGASVDLVNALQWRTGERLRKKLRLGLTRLRTRHHSNVRTMTTEVNYGLDEIRFASPEGVSNTPTAVALPLHGISTFIFQ